MEKKDFEIILHDTAGQEKFRAITYNYYKSSDGILLIYDITDRSSFENVEQWMNSIKDTIGNKLDLINTEYCKREVTVEESENICKQHDLIWGGEQSAKDIKFEDLQELFKGYVKQIYERVGEKKQGKQTLKKVQKYKKKINCGNCMR